jgi:hypothetical protein
LAQYTEIAIGDEIAHRSGGMEHYQMVFGGALPGEDGGFSVQVALYKAAGYGGMGASLIWNVREGGRIRLGHHYMAYEEPERRKKVAFHKIERDYLIISCDWM